MEYVRFGSTGLKVSRICWGCLMLFFVLILSSCIQEDTIGADKTLTESEYSEETGETDDASSKPEDAVEAGETMTESDYSEETGEMYNYLTTNNLIRDIVNHPALKYFGNAMLPRDDNTAHYDTPLNIVGSLMSYHNHVDPEIVVGAINHMIDEVNDGKTIFYDFYDNEQKQQDPAKGNTGLFFFRGNPDAPFAIVCPGGGFSYVGSLHEGFPLALEISKKGYNAFVIRYRIGSELRATEDLAAAIAYIFRNAELLEVSTEDYALWGGSAGARIVGDIAVNGISAYGGGPFPKPATVVIAYTGQSTYSSDFSPAFITVAANDRIANINTVERRVENLKNTGVEVEYRRYESAGHGFGLGTGTDAEGWLDLAVQFWEKHIADSLHNDIPQQIYLWDEGNMPTVTEYTENTTGYFDPPDFHPHMVYFSVKQGVDIQGAVLVSPGGAFQFRSDGEGEPVAEQLSELGYQSFVVNYRLRPYTVQEGALDLARAVRYVRAHAGDLGINEHDIVVMGFSAGGILGGEMLLNFDGTVNGTAIDPGYIPDELDCVPADANAAVMVYSFYGRLAVASTDVAKFVEADLPPTYFVYGTRDPFVPQFEVCVAALREARVPVESHALEGWPHGFGSGDGQWILDFDKWLTNIFNH